MQFKNDTKRENKALTIIFCLVLICAWPGAVFTQTIDTHLYNVNAQFAFDEESQKQMMETNLASMSLAFTENQGQFGDKTMFKANAGGATFYFCKDEVAYLFVRDTDELLKDDRHMLPDMPDKFDHLMYKKESLLIRAQFIGANPNPEMIGIDRLSYNNNYFYGNDPLKWHADVPNYSAIVYRDIYPGIDLKYYGDGKSMKYDFIVNPGADISQIQIRYDGVDALSVTHAGDLQAQTQFGLIHEKVPYIYQDAGGVQTEVTGYYDIRESGVFGFAVVDGYNPDYPLIIDPELVYSTYLGGGGKDYGYGIAIDGSGSAYVTGYTTSRDFPTVNPYDGNYNRKGDVFVTKLSPAGNSLTYSTYLGGGDDDRCWGITVDSSGSAYMTGATRSSDFPMANPYDNSLDSYWDAFVTKLSPGGNSLVYSTYLGGNIVDYGEGIAVDAGGSAYVTGHTVSSDFPMVNPYDGGLDGDRDCFVSKLSPSGNSLAYSTYLGGDITDWGFSIAVDVDGSAFVTGVTMSSDFPTVDPYDGSLGGDRDGFVTKLSPGGNSLVYSTYLGGVSNDGSYDIAIDGSGCAYVIGGTYSSDFPTVNPYDGSLGGDRDGFVTKLSPGGNSLVYSTYLGGVSDDGGVGIAVDALGSAYVTGWTSSSDFPTVNPFEGSLSGNYDVFITKLTPTGNSLTYSTYLGGRASDIGRSIAIDGSGSAYVTGYTRSRDFPTVNPFDGRNNGYDAFVAKLTEDGMLDNSTEIIAKVIKKVPVAEAPNVPDQSVILQGGDDVSSATVIAGIPYNDNGTTSGYNDDYDEVCAFGSTSPDVVYSFTPAVDTIVDVDLWGSSYDTKLFVYENNVTPGSPFACNDDYHSDYTSALFYLHLSANNTYYFVVDGYDGAHGNYLIGLTASGYREPCQYAHTYSDPWVALLSDNGPFGEYLVYDDFDGAETIFGITFYGFMLFNSGGNLDICTENPASFEVAFYEDSLGQPGTQVESFTGQAFQSVAGMFGSWPLTEFQMEFTTPFNMTSGWLSVQGVSNPSSCMFYMLSGTGGNTHSYHMVNSLLNDRYFDQAWCLDTLLVSIDEVELLPTELDMLTCYPNPFNAQTTISYELVNPAYVTLQVYDILGREVETLVNEQKQAGHHSIIWNASDQTSGIYFYKIQAGDFTEAKKMLLLK